MTTYNLFQFILFVYLQSDSKVKQSSAKIVKAKGRGKYIRSRQEQSQKKQKLKATIIFKLI
jgi:hypothetical protein